MSLVLSWSHRFSGGTCLDIAFEAPLPGVIGLFGPSGAGKSLSVAALAGLFRPQNCSASLDGRVLAGPGLWVRPERRRIGLVFQDARLFPHLDVAGNLDYGARRAHAQAPGPGLDEVVALLGLGTLLSRPVKGLSGGEAQRVAIGRALLSRPALLVMDEPLSGLDRVLRDEILPWLARLRDRAGLPILYVTHSRREALLLCDALVRIEAGRVVGIGSPADMLPCAPRADAVVLLPDGGTLPLSSARATLRVRVRELRPAERDSVLVMLDPVAGERPEVLHAIVGADKVTALGLASGKTVLALINEAGESDDE